MALQTRMAAQKQTAIFRWPLILAFLTLTGLVGALVADGIWDVIGWIFLGIPSIAGLFFWCMPFSAKR